MMGLLEDSNKLVSGQVDGSESIVAPGRSRRQDYLCALWPTSLDILTSAWSEVIAANT